MNTLRKFIGVPVLACCFVASSLAAEPPVVKDPASTPKSATLTRGKYLVTLGGCHDCHTPKLMTEKGPVLDTKRLLSGFPSSEKAPAIPEGVIGPKSWGGLFTKDGTGWAGPWGISFASNLTPDKETGIGVWTEKTFIKTDVRPCRTSAAGRGDIQACEERHGLKARVSGARAGRSAQSWWLVPDGRGHCLRPLMDAQPLNPPVNKVVFR